MKAFCLVFSFLLLILPAHAEQISAAPRQVQVNETEAARLYRNEWLRQKFASEGAAAAAFQSTADAQFAAKFRAMIAAAKEMARRAATGPDPVTVHLHIRCAAKRVLVKRTRPQPFAPALAWSAVEIAPTPVIASKLVRACAFELTRRRPAPEPQVQPYSIELPLIEPTGQ